MKVKATKRGYYDNQLRRIGDIFTVRVAADFAPKWMVRVEDTTRERRTTSQDVLDQVHDERGIGPMRRRAPAIDDDDGRAAVEWDPFR